VSSASNGRCPAGRARQRHLGTQGGAAPAAERQSASASDDGRHPCARMGGAMFCVVKLRWAQSTGRALDPVRRRHARRIADLMRASSWRRSLASAPWFEVSIYGRLV
jgi:hypothetical protein